MKADVSRRGAEPRCVDEHGIAEDWPPPDASPAATTNRVGSPTAVTATATNSPFSPNHDGVKDLGGVLPADKRAYVTVRVNRAGTTVLLRKVGRLRAGTHYFVWNGVGNGLVVPDATTYAVSVAAPGTRHGEAHFVSSALTVDARYRSLGIGSNRGPVTSSVVYPRTTVIHDVVLGRYETGRTPGDASTRLSPGPRSSRSVRGSKHRVG